MENRYINALIFFSVILVGGFLSILAANYIFDNLSISTIKTIVVVLIVMLIEASTIAWIFKRRLKKHEIKDTL
jgi:VIT1/CCC1 family predicted Fe2+/Mn2+ transporter